MILNLQINVPTRREPLEPDLLQLSFNDTLFKFNRVLGFGSSGTVLSFMTCNHMSPTEYLAVKIHAKTSSKSYPLHGIACTRRGKECGLRAVPLHNGHIEVLDQMDSDLYSFIVDGGFERLKQAVSNHHQVAPETAEAMVMGGILGIVRDQVLCMMKNNLDYLDIKCENVMVNMLSTNTISVGLGDLDSISNRPDTSNSVNMSTFKQQCDRCSAHVNDAVRYTLHVLYVHMVYLITGDDDVLNIIKPTSDNGDDSYISKHEIIDRMYQNTHCAGVRYHATFLMCDVAHCLPVVTAVNPNLSNLPDICARQPNGAFLYYNNDQHNKLVSVRMGVSNTISKPILEMTFQDETCYTYEPESMIRDVRSR
jgi:hypothetical protein